MSKVLLSMFAGVVLGGIFTAVFVFPDIRTERKLIEQWRRIAPGMNSAEVETLLGEPKYRFETGKTWPHYGGPRFPEEFQSNHGLSVYYVGGVGPQLLLVIDDAEGRVAFVTSAST